MVVTKQFILEGALSIIFVASSKLLNKEIFFYIPYGLVIIFTNLLDLIKISKFSLSERVYGLSLLKKLDTNKMLENANKTLSN